MDEWINVKDGLPNKDTRHAAKYGVPVLVFDEEEYKDSGSYVPNSVSFNYEQNWFMTYATGPKGGMWVPLEVTHWKPLPEIPKIEGE